MVGLAHERGWKRKDLITVRAVGRSAALAGWAYLGRKGQEGKGDKVREKGGVQSLKSMTR